MKQLTPFELGKMVAYKDQNFSIREISEIMKIPKSTVSAGLKRYKDRGTFERKRGSGRPSLFKETHKSVMKKILDKEPKISAPKLGKKV